MIAYMKMTCECYTLVVRQPQLTLKKKQNKMVEGKKAPIKTSKRFLLFTDVLNMGMGSISGNLFGDFFWVAFFRMAFFLDTNKITT